jgi:hypothetical protein
MPGHLRLTRHCATRACIPSSPDAASDPREIVAHAVDVESHGGGEAGIGDAGTPDALPPRGVRSEVVAVDDCVDDEVLRYDRSDKDDQRRNALAVDRAESTNCLISSSLLCLCTMRAQAPAYSGTRIVTVDPSRRRCVRGAIRARAGLPSAPLPSPRSTGSSVTSSSYVSAANIASPTRTGSSRRPMLTAARCYSRSPSLPPRLG